MDRKKIIVAFIGAIFLLMGLYSRSISYEFIGAGTWFSGLIYYTIFKKYREITSFLIGLIILHAGVILLLIENLSNQKLLGFLIFSSGVVIVLGSGFSDYIRKR